MVRLKVRRVGNSVGFTIPRQAALALKIGVGDTIFLTETPGGYRITPYDPDFQETVTIAEGFMSRYRNALRELAK